MSKYARELLKKNESAVVIFTRGEKFYFDKSGSGYSGNWIIRRDHFDRVIIYCRAKERSAGAEIYIGIFDRIDQAIEPETPENRISRRSIHFNNLKRVGETDVNFHQFTETKRNSFCFIN
jgi:flavin-dependent dehydrogenase